MFSNIYNNIYSAGKYLYEKVIPSSKKDIPVNIKAILEHAAREAEDVSTRKSIRARSLSTSKINKGALTEKEEIKKRDGHLWECIGRTFQGVGYIYQFKLREVYDDFTPSELLETRKKAALEKNLEINPAAEPRPQDIFFLDENLSNEILFQEELNIASRIFPVLPDFMYEGVSEEIKSITRRGIESNRQELAKKQLNTKLELRDDLKFLGYNCRCIPEGVYIDLPDQETLLSQWKLLQEKYPHLPDLSINSSEGVADDLSFVQSLFTHDALLSKGIEFVHDQGSHVLRLISLLLSTKNVSKEFLKEHLKSIKAIMAIYKEIVSFKDLVDMKKIHLTEKQENLFNAVIACLGALVDTFAAQSSLETLKNFTSRNSYFPDYIQNIWADRGYRNNFQARFGPLEPVEVKNFWFFMLRELKKHS